MPQVPLYNGPQVQTQALKPVYQGNIDVSSGAQALARGLGQAGEALDRIALRDAEAKANETDTQLTRDFDEWENLNRGKYTNQNADGYRAAVDAWWKEAPNKYGAGLDPRAQSLVNKILKRRQTIALDQAGKYEFAEKEKYADSTTESALTTATVNALKTGDYAGEAQRIRDLTAQQGVRKNWDKDQRDAALNARLGAFNVAVITQMAEKDAADAQTYLTGAIQRGEIRPEQQTKLESVIKGEADNQFARAKGVELLGMTPEQRTAEFAKITDPQRLEKTQIAFKTQLGLQKLAEQEAQQAAADRAWTQFVDKGRPVPQSIREAMGETNLRELINFEKARADNLAAGAKPVKTNPMELAKLLDLQATDPQRFAKEFRAEAYAYKLSGTDLEQLSKARAAILNPKPEKDLVSFNNKVTARVEMMGATGERNAEKRGQFRLAAQKEFEAYVAANGKAPSPKDEDAILDRLMIPGKTWFGGDSETYAESVATGKSFVPKISSEDRDTLRERFAKKNVNNPSEEQILQAYKIWKGL